MATSDSPFTQVHAALWDMLLDRADFAAAIRAGNRDKLTDQDVPRPEKSALQRADLPDVRIVPGKTKYPATDATSGSSEITRQWVIQITTGDEISDTLDEIDWMVYRAHRDWRTRLTILVAKTGGDPFVRTSVMLDAETRLEDQDAPHGKGGWVTYWIIEVEMQFQPAFLSEA